jgi:transposase
MCFMQDNASIHTTQKVKDWFAEQQVWCTDWPPYSPDLNPIENVTNLALASGLQGLHHVMLGAQLCI